MKRKLIASIGKCLDDVKTIEVFEYINKFENGVNNAKVERNVKIGVRGTTRYHMRKLMKGKMVQKKTYEIEDSGVTYYLYTTTAWGREVFQYIHKVSSRYYR